MRHGVQRLMVCVALALCAGQAAAQDRSELLRQRPGSGLKADSIIVAEIGEMLASADSAQRKAGMETLRARIQQRGMGELRTTWFKTLVNHKLYQELVDIARDGVLAHPHETRNVEAVLQARIKALIVLGRSKEALSEARSLFNVSGMTGTADAILAFAEVLSVVHPNDPDIYNRFRDEQVAGVGPQTTGDAATRPTKAVVCTVLTSVPIDPAPFDQALTKITGEDAQSLLGRGNLLLMSGRPAEARALFEKMYALAGADLVEASESLARCIKAEDGTIGRANAYILSLRPKR